LFCQVEWFIKELLLFRKAKFEGGKRKQELFPTNCIVAFFVSENNKTKIPAGLYVLLSTL